jgi:SAM-dependent methyltransferase
MARQDVHFNAAMHLRLLLRVERTLGIEKAIGAALRPGSRVLDAGCGSGILSFLALRAGASEVVAVDRDNVELARALARDNGLERRIRFLDADLGRLEPSDVGGSFDAILAFVYTNHIAVDEARSRLVTQLRRRFGSATAATVPNRVRYYARACDWPQQDAFTELADLKDSLAELEQRYQLKLGAFEAAMTAEILYDRSRPTLYGAYKWMPGGGSGGYRHRRDGVRFLGGRTPVAEIAYDGGLAFERLPERLSLEIAAAGTLGAVLWVQELWFEDQLIWTAEALSPLAAPVPARAGDCVVVALDEGWRSTNLLGSAVLKHR